MTRTTEIWLLKGAYNRQAQVSLYVNIPFSFESFEPLEFNDQTEDRCWNCEDEFLSKLNLSIAFGNHKCGAYSPLSGDTKTNFPKIS